MKSILLPVLAVAMLAAQAQDSAITVEPFMPDLFVDLPHVRDIAMDWNGEEIFFTVDDPKHRIGFLATATISYAVPDMPGFTEPRIMPFSGKYRDIEPFLTYDGKRLFFASNRPLEGQGPEVKDYDIYYVERDSVGAPWGDPVRLPAPINTEADEFYPSLTVNNDLFFTCAREGGVGAEDIYEVPFSDGEYQEPFAVSGGLNTEGYEYNAFVGPYNSYMLYSSYRERDGRRRNDLYISFRDENGIWNEGTLVPGVYSDAVDYCPFVHWNSEKLYFTSERTEMPAFFQEAQDLESFLATIRSTPNGTSRIYVTDFKKILESLGYDAGGEE